jgi:hypothetical protein
MISVPCLVEKSTPLTLGALDFIRERPPNLLPPFYNIQMLHVRIRRFFTLTRLGVLKFVFSKFFSRYERIRRIRLFLKLWIYVSTND